MTGDWWGLHIATELGTLTHWNASSGDFEDGMQLLQSQYPVQSMMSNGNEVLVLAGQNDAVLVEARTTNHAALTTLRPGDVIEGTLGANHVWVTTENGLRGWYTNGQYPPVDEATMRRALPLTLRAMNNGAGLNVTDTVSYTHLTLPTNREV